MLIGQIIKKIINNVSLIYTNLIRNGNFANGAIDWSASGSTLSVSNNVLTVTATGSNLYVHTEQSNVTSYVSGKKIYLKVLFKIINTQCLSVETRISATGMALQLKELVANPVNGTIYSIGKIFTLPSGGSGNIKFSITQRYADAPTANGKVMEIREVLIVDVSSRTVDEQTLAWCDANLAFKI